MPQIKAAKKALRVSGRKRAVNDRWRQKLRDSFRAMRDAVANSDVKAAEKALVKASSNLDKAARRNIIHRHKAARKKSQLQKVVSSLSQQAKK